MIKSRIKTNNDVKKVIPPINLDDFNNLKKSVKKSGLKEPIEIWKGTVIDGYNRLEICKELGIKPDLVELEFASLEKAIKYRIGKHFRIRKLTDIQDSYLRGFQMELMKSKRGVQTAGGETRVLLAQLHKVTPRTITADNLFYRGMEKLKKKNISLFDDIYSGKTTINKKYAIALLYQKEPFEVRDLAHLKTFERQDTSTKVRTNLTMETELLDKLKAKAKLENTTASKIVEDLLKDLFNM